MGSQNKLYLIYLQNDFYYLGNKEFFYKVTPDFDKRKERK